MPTRAKQIVVNLTLSAVAGAAIWALAPALTGHTEPWDSDGLYYPLALFAAGILLGSIGPRAIWAHAVGIVLGQLLYMLFFCRSGRCCSWVWCSWPVTASSPWVARAWAPPSERPESLS